MKLKYIIIAVILFFALFFTYKILMKQQKVVSIEGHFSRNIVDSFDMNNSFRMPLGNQKNHIAKGAVSYLVYNATTSFENERSQETKFSTYPVENEIDLIGSAKYNNLTHYVYRDSQTWIRGRRWINDSGKVVNRLFKTKLPMQTYGAHVLDSTHLLVWYFDFKAKENKLAVIDTLGRIIRNYPNVWSGINDGGLSVACSIIANDSSIFIVSQYTNNVAVVNRQSGKISRYHTLEKISDYPPVLKMDKAYSFKRNPYLIHTKAKWLGDKLYVLSCFADDESLKKEIAGASYIDVYDSSLKYLYSIQFKNMTARKITDFSFIRDNFILILQREAFTGKLKGEIGA